MNWCKAIDKPVSAARRLAVETEKATEAGPAPLTEGDDCADGIIAHEGRRPGGY
jgi:hypothetical protein